MNNTSLRKIFSASAACTGFAITGISTYTIPFLILDNLKTGDIGAAAAKTALVTTGVALAAIGYSRTAYKGSPLEKELETLKRGKISTGFNIAAATVGASMMAPMALLLTKSVSNINEIGGFMFMASLGMLSIIAAPGLALFAAGYSRFFGSGKVSNYLKASHVLKQPQP